MARVSARDRDEAREIDAARQHARASSRATRKRVDERRRNGRKKVDVPKCRDGRRAGARVREVGSVQRERTDARTDGERWPCGEPEMRVNDAERRPRATSPGAAGGPVDTPQVHRRERKRARAGRKLVELDVEAGQAPQRGDLVAHEAAALWVRGVGEHVREDERAHVPCDRSALE